jgi:RNA polymerase sigma-70 factor (ECF subfamily)
MDAQQQQVLQRAQQLDPRALTEIFNEFSPGLYRYALRRTGNQQLAEDCVSETFARLLTYFQQRRQKINTSLRAFLYRMAHNWLIDQYRREPIQPDELDEAITVDHAPGPELAAENRDQQHRLRQALFRLPPAQQQVIALRYLEEWSLEECAETMGKTIGAVKSLQHRAEQNLRSLLTSTEK